jgi:RNA polymerase subunit RPABC4/transcription elongation factor Spt4
LKSWIKQNEVLVGLAVQAKNEAMICERCFAMVKHGSEFCPECGAPMGNGPAEGSDAAIYTELARANLLRMRGEYKGALDQCRSILHKFPNNVSANQLLGDLCVETGDLEQAKEWYELALDIAPNHAQIQKKLNEVQQTLEHAETEGLVEQLGLPPSKPKNGLIAVGLAALVLGVGAIAYILGTQKPAATSVNGVTRTQIQAPSTSVTNPQVDTTTGTEGAVTSPTTTPPSGSTEEASLAQIVGQRSTNGSKLLSLVVDPRTNLLTLTYRAEAADDKRLIGAELAATTFENGPSIRLITIRAIENGAVAYVADARRDAYEQTKTDEWKQQNGTDPGALAKHILTQEWPATQPAPQTATTGTEQDVNNPGP